MGKLFKSSEYFQRRISSWGLEVFRICFGFVMLAEVSQMFRFRRLIFDRVPFIDGPEITIDPVLIAWMASLICLIVGFQTRLAAIANAICSLLTLGTFHEYEYHFDHIAHGVNMVLPLLPLGQAWGVDAWFKRHNTATGHWSPPLVHPIAFVLLWMIGAAIPYFDSFLWKCTQTIWLDGLGIWTPLSQPHNTWSNPEQIQALLDQPLLYKTGNWLTLFLEFSFIWLVWFRWTRVYILLPLGVVLHIGIWWAFPIPLFALGMLTFYTLLIPESWYAALDRHFNCWVRNRTAQPFTQVAPISNSQTAAANATVPTKSQQPNLAPLYPAEFSLATKLQIGLLTGLTIAAFIIQMLFALETPALRNRQMIKAEYRGWIHWGLGLCPHGVFLDHHFANYDHVTAISYIHPDGRQEWLPLTTSGGQMDQWPHGRLWAKWAFRGNNPYLIRSTLARTARDFTAFWAHENNIDLKTAVFVLMAKRYTTVEPGEPRAFLKQIEQPWQMAGTLVWTNEKCEVVLADIEQLGTSPIASVANKDLGMSLEKVSIER